MEKNDLEGAQRFWTFTFVFLLILLMLFYFPFLAPVGLIIIVVFYTLAVGPGAAYYD